MPCAHLALLKLPFTVLPVSSQPQQNLFLGKAELSQASGNAGAGEDEIWTKFLLFK
jgi:hypothetical protein